MKCIAAVLAVSNQSQSQKDVSIAETCRHFYTGCFKLGESLASFRPGAIMLSQSTDVLMFSTVLSV